MADPVVFLTQELHSEDAAQSVDCIARLRVIGLALGTEKTRSSLIPMLTQHLDPKNAETELRDEVKVEIAIVLGKFVDFVGGAKHAHCLLEPLLSLCLADESTVRDEAVRSINAIGAQLDEKQLSENLFEQLKLTTPFVSADDVLLPKGVTHSPFLFAPKVSACGLYALACARASDDTRANILAMFGALAADESPMVRRAAASNLAGLVASFKDFGSREEKFLLKSRQGESKESRAGVYKELLADDQESVRVHAVKAIPAILKKVLLLLWEASSPDADKTLADVVEKTLLDVTEKTLAEYLKAATEDKAWRVRNACADVIAEVATTCGEVLSGTRDYAAIMSGRGTALLQMLERIYITLATQDREHEVRIAAALKGDIVAHALGPEAAVKIFHQLDNLVMDRDTARRVELAAVFAKLAEPLSKESAAKLLLPQLQRLADAETEPTLNVRLAVINQFATLIDVVGCEPQSELLDLIIKLGRDQVGEEKKKWRIQHAIVHLLPKLAEVVGQKGLVGRFGEESINVGMQNLSIAEVPACSYLRQFAFSEYALIRDDFAAVVLPALTKTWGIEWLAEIVVPVLKECAEHKQYQVKSVLLPALLALQVRLILADEWNTEVLKPLYQQAWKFLDNENKSTNLQIRTVEVLGALAAAFKALPPADGLKWKEAGAEKPAGGEELTHPKLSEALKGKTSFTQKEWEAFGVKDLRMSHFIKAGDKYFQPAAPALGYSEAHNYPAGMGKDFPERLGERMNAAGIESEVAKQMLEEAIERHKRGDLDKFAQQVFLAETGRPWR